MNDDLEAELALLRAMNAVLRLSLGYVDLPPVNQQENAAKKDCYLANGTYVGSSPSRDDQQNGSPFKVPEVKDAPSVAKKSGKEKKQEHHLKNGTCVGAASPDNGQQEAGDKEPSPFKIPTVGPGQ